jgi:hypothetical protein
VAGGWRRLRNEGLHNLYASPDVIRVFNSGRMKWAMTVIGTRDVRNAYQILVRKPKMELPFGRYRRRLEDNIRMTLSEIGLENVSGYVGLRIRANGRPL